MADKKYILALDQGTTSSRALLFDRQQKLIGCAQKAITQIYPHEGWVEQDPMEIYSSQHSVMMEVITKNGIQPNEIAAIGIANQRETTIIWDRYTGQPIYNAIVWQCRRSAPIIEELKKNGCAQYIQAATGLIPDAYFSGSKIKWILDTVPHARTRAENGDLLFGTIDTWLVYKLTSAQPTAQHASYNQTTREVNSSPVHVTDYTNASRTMLYNIHELKWDEQLLKWLDIPVSILPKVVESGEIVGYTNISGSEIPIASMIGDQQAALFGQTCFEKGNAKNTYGTGCFLLMNTGNMPCKSTNGLLTTIASALKGKIQYALEGSVFIGGAVIQWLRDELNMLTDSGEAAFYASRVPDTGGVYLVPAFTGLGAPYWDMYARGCLIGLTRGTKKEHIIRAAQEAIAYQCYDLVAAMEKDTALSITELNVDGGASRDTFLMQFQADLLDKKVVRPELCETTALGAADLAGLTVGFWKDYDEIKSLRKNITVYSSHMPADCRTKYLKGWHKAVSKSLQWEEPER